MTTTGHACKPARLPFWLNEEVSAMTDLKGRRARHRGSRGHRSSDRARARRRGASVAVGFVSNEGAEQVAAEIATRGGTAFAFGCDVQGCRGDRDGRVANVVERFGKIDALVNNAGITRDWSLAKMSPEEWDAVIQTNLTSVFQMTSRVLPHMVEAGYGRIEHQLGDRRPWQSRPGELRRGQGRDHRLHEVCRARGGPQGRHGQRDRAGSIETEMIAAMPEDVRAKILAKIPMGRLACRRRSAQAAAFLISSGDYITGQVIAIDGGLYT